LSRSCSLATAFQHLATLESPKTSNTTIVYKGCFNCLELLTINFLQNAGLRVVNGGGKGRLEP
jgi:hypothetical protein